MTPVCSTTLPLDKSPSTRVREWWSASCRRASASSTSVAPGFFQTIGTRLVAGRDFTWVDLEGRRPVAVISENLARELWREPRAALGKRIREGAGSLWREVVGVVADVYDDGVHRQAPSIVYWPSFMETFLGQPFNVRRAVTFAIRSSRAGSESLLTQVRGAMSSQLMASLLFGTSTLDPTIYVLVSLGLVGIAALASYVPARSATLVDPVQTLRGE